MCTSYHTFCGIHMLSPLLLRFGDFPRSWNTLTNNAVGCMSLSKYAPSRTGRLWPWNLWIRHRSGCESTRIRVCLFMRDRERERERVCVRVSIYQSIALALSLLRVRACVRGCVRMSLWARGMCARTLRNAPHLHSSPVAFTWKVTPLHSKFSWYQPELCLPLIMNRPGCLW